MGLPSLKQKIQDKLGQKNYSEEDVLYLLVEMGKYLERSGKEFDDPIELKVNKNGFSAIVFFRNWVAHPNIDRYIPENILVNLKNVSSKDNQETEKELFNLLVGGITKFCKASNIEVNINWDSFLARLRYVLAEQPVEVSHEEKFVVGYDVSLTLRKF